MNIVSCNNTSLNRTASNNAPPYQTTRMQLLGITTVGHNRMITFKKFECLNNRSNSSRFRWVVTLCGDVVTT